MVRDFSHPGRSAVWARNGMIATSHPIASAVGLRMLTEGGSAVDAVLAAAAVLAVAEPHMTGLGGDCFALVSQEGEDGTAEIKAINGSGAAPQAIDIEALAAAGLSDEIPRHSPHAVTVPGAVDAWVRLHEHFGKMDWDKVLWPSLAYATEGLVVHERVARDWGLKRDNLVRDADGGEQYLKRGEAYRAGDIFSQPRLAKALKLLMHEGRDGFYKGAVAEDIVSKLRALGGFHSEADFAGYGAEFVAPISADYRGHTIWECPPNGQGITALILLGLLGYFDLGSMDEVGRIHVLAEASKIAYGFRDRYVADPKKADVSLEGLLSDGTLEGYAERIDMTKAQNFTHSDFLPESHTVYLCAVDRDGLAVSFINSLFDDFGSGISTPEYGILLHSRGRGFRLERGHANVLEGGKRPLHTIIPGMLTRGGRFEGVFGVMGGQYQPVGHAMLAVHLFEHGLGPQAALDAGRSFWHAGVLQLEGGFGAEVASGLQARGHAVDYPCHPLGGGQVILRDFASGFYVAGSDSRKDGLAIGY